MIPIFAWIASFIPNKMFDEFASRRDAIRNKRVLSTFNQDVKEQWNAVTNVKHAPELQSSIRDSAMQNVYFSESEEQHAHRYGQSTCEINVDTSKKSTLTNENFDEILRQINLGSSKARK